MAILMLAFAAKAETIFLECERFKDLGGWKIESQFQSELGSSYLIAHGFGRPVADATTTFSVQTGGTFRAYVLTKNWTAKWSPNVPGAGRFHLIVNGETAARPLGVDGDGRWTWQMADNVTLKTGLNTVSLHDATGFDGRADVVCFTTESTFPAALRQKGVGVEPIPPETTRSFDLVVAGGGVAGITTAISAARLGLKVALVQNRPVLGGNNSSEVRVQLGGYANVPPYPRLGDVVNEIAPEKGGNAEKAETYQDDRKLAAVKSERNISLFLNTNIKSVQAETTNGTRRIVSATGVDAVTGARTRFVAPLFADCTGDGNVASHAGAWLMTGREGRDRYGEPSAPEKGDKMAGGASVQWRARSTTGAMPFPVEPWMLALDETNAVAKYKGEGNWEVGVDLDPFRDAETIRDYGLLVAYSNWAAVKNAEKTRRQYSAAVLDWVAQVAGRRASRRIQGDFILTENHIVNREAQPDGTCVATGPIELRAPLTEEESHFKGAPFLSNAESKKIHPYAIPYRCLYSKNISNLFMAGRDISVSHVALGAARLMRTCGMMGEVVGMAASLCKKNSCAPRDIYPKHFDDLKALMTKGVGRGGKQPPQNYNLPESLDKDIAKAHSEAVWGRTAGPVSVNDVIQHLDYVRRQGTRAGEGWRACEKVCAEADAIIAKAAEYGFTSNDIVKLHVQCLDWARGAYYPKRVEHHYEAVRAIAPNYKGDEVFQARSEINYRVLQLAKKFPLDEKDIPFGQTLKSMGVVEKKTAHLKDYWNPTNVTEAFQALVDDPEVTTIVLDKTDKPYYVSSVRVGEKVTGKRILLKSGVKLLRAPEFLRHRTDQKTASLITFASCQNVIFESDAEKPEDVLVGYYESRHERLKWNKREGNSGLSVGHKNFERPTRNIVIRNVRIADCECDGLGVGALWNPPEEVFVENVILDSNFRQGCSPCSYFTLYFKNVTFSNTCGGQPMAGLDAEPWDDYLTTGALYLFDCTFENNLGGGFLVATTTHEPILMLAKRCTFKPNGRAPQVSVVAMPTGYFHQKNVPQTDIRFEDCTFLSRGTTLSYNPCPVYNITLKNCVIRDMRGENERKRSRVSPIRIGLTREFGITDIPEGATPSLTFDNVKIEGFEGSKPLTIADEMGKMNLGRIFHGSVEMNGEKTDLSSVTYKAPDLDEPKTEFVPTSKLLKPARVAAEGEAIPPSGCKLIFSGAWWLRQPIHSYYFWAEKGRKVSFDFSYTGPSWVKLPDAPLFVTGPSGRDVKIADVSKGATNLSYVAETTGWHRFTPGLSLDAKSRFGSGIEYYVSNIKGAHFAWQADTVSDCFAKYTLADKDVPYTAYFEVPAGGKPCRIRANYGGFVLKDPAGNVVDTVYADGYTARHVFTIQPSTDKAEIWSLTTPTGTAGGWTRALRFYAPLNGIWADSPETLPCVFADHYVPPKKETVPVERVVVRIDRARLSPEAVSTLDRVIAERKAFAEKKENAAQRDRIERQIEDMKKGGVTDAIQHQIDDLMNAVKMHDRLARMEERAAKESPEDFEVAAFCQAFVKLLIDDQNATDLDERIAEELRGYEVGYPMGVIEYSDEARLAPLVDVLYGKLKK